MTNDTISTVGKYLIAVGALAGCFGVIVIAAPGSDNTQAWSGIFLIIGWIVRDSAGSSATTNAVKTIAAANGQTA